MGEKYKKITLENGIRLILIPDNSRKVVTSMIVFGVGSRYESDEMAGISHVLEHMFYKGSKKRPSSAQISEFIEDIGGDHNAFTSKEYTGFYAKVAAKHIERSFDFLADLLINPLFLSHELEKEKLVILQELSMYEDLPMDVVANKFEEALFGHNALGRDIIGLAQTIKNVTSDQLRDYHSTYYTTQNAVIAVAGNFNGKSEEEIKKLIEKYFTLPAKPAPKYQEIELNRESNSVAIEKKTDQSHLIIGFPGVSIHDDDKYKLKVLGLILGGAMSSRMFKEIREKRGLAYAVRTSTENYQDAGSIDTYVGIPHNKTAETKEAILAEYRNIKNGISAEELARAREIILGKMLIGLENTNEVASHYAMSELLGGEIKTPDELAQIYNAITAEQIKAVAKKYLDEEKLAISYVGPEKIRK